MSAPFIGSRISLISKSDVRYEGILCGIDTNESKVYLQHVRCFGTEDRRKENPIAPATEVYEVIIFHSSDIKDLSVCELPPPVAYDPMNFNQFSHMGSGYPPQYGYPPMVHPQYGPQYGYPYGPYGHNYGMYPQSPSMMGPQDNAGAYPAAGEQSNEKPAPISAQPPQKINVTTTKVDSSSQSQPSSSETHPADNNNETHDAQTHNADNHNNDNAKADVTPSDESHSQKSNNFYNKNQNNNQNKRNNNRNNNNNFVYLPKGEAQRNNQTEKSNDNTPNNNAQQADSSANSDQQNNRQNNHNNQSDYRQKRGNSNNRGYKNHYNNNRRGFDSRGHQNSSDQSHFHKPKEQNEPRSQEDFDFLISNSKFEKLSISALPGELEKELPKISPSYNKDSFYDNISCDTLDREDQKEKKTYYEQRKLDSETFGDMGRRQSNNNRGRTRGRYDTHSQNNNNQNNYSGNSNNNNQRRYNNNYNNNNRGNRNYRGNKNASGNPANASDIAAQN